MSHIVAVLKAILNHPTALGPLWYTLLTLAGLPLVNELVQRAKGSSPTSLLGRAQSIGQFLAGFALSIPAVGAIIAKFPIVGDILYALAPQNKTGLPKSLSKVWMDARTAKKANDNSKPPATPPAAVALVLFFVAATTLSGCLPTSALCKTPAPTLVAKCILENNLIACGKSDIVPALGVLADVLLAEVNHTFTSALLETDLEAQGISDAPCVASAIESYMADASPIEAAKVHEALKNILIKKGFHGSVTIKLKSGAKIVVVTPVVVS